MGKTGPGVRRFDDCRNCKKWDTVGHQVRVRSVLESVTDKMEDQVTDTGFKPSVVDFLKVLDAENDFEIPQTGPGLLTVIWKDPTEISEN